MKDKFLPSFIIKPFNTLNKLSINCLKNKELSPLGFKNPLQYLTPFYSIKPIFQNQQICIENIIILIRGTFLIGSAG